MKQKSVFLFAGIAMSLPASAHVKWFSMMADCASTPLTTFNVLSCPLFAGLAIAAFVAMFAVSTIDAKISRGDNPASRMAAWLDHGTTGLIAAFVRIGVALYFVSVVIYFHGSPIILTVDLKTHAAWVPLLQLLISVAVLNRRGALLAAMGITVLFAYAVHRYGMFHMLDYPFFMGLAAFLVVDSVGGPSGRTAGLALLRVTVGFSLLWCGVEKWLYPDWTLELLRADLHVLLGTGFSPAFIVMGAGFVEFSLAFLLIFGRLASQAAAVALLSVMLLAIPVVGVLDLIGHLPIIVVLIILAATRNPIGRSAPEPRAQRRCVRDAAILFLLGVPGSIAAYYLGHEMAYSAFARVNRIEALVDSLLLVLLLVHLVRMAPSLFREVNRSRPAMEDTQAGIRIAVTSAAI